MATIITENLQKDHYPQGRSQGRGGRRGMPPYVKKLYHTLEKNGKIKGKGEKSWKKEKIHRIKTKIQKKQRKSD